MSMSIFNQFSLAFFTMTAANYGTIKFYNQVGFLSWLGYPALAIFGSKNLFEIEANLRGVYENTLVTLRSWQKSTAFATNRMKKCLKACKALKLYQGGFSFSDRKTCVTFHYNEFHFTVNLLRTKN